MRFCMDLCLAVVLIQIAWTDIRTMMIPDRVLVPGGTFGIYGAGNSIYCPAHRDLLHSTSHVPCKSFCGRGIWWR
mgnify:CR=1 FL=1